MLRTDLQDPGHLQRVWELTEFASEFESDANIKWFQSTRALAEIRRGNYQDAVDWGVQFVPAYDLYRDGVQSAIELIQADANIIICLDVDALDPSIVPGVIGRTPGGLDYYQVLDLIKGASERGQVAAVDVVEYMPEVDVDNLGALVVSRLIANTMGIIARN